MNRRACAITALFVCLGLLAACSSDENQGTSPGVTSTSVGGAEGSDAPPGSEVAGTIPPPAGLPAFYGVPDPLPVGAPGDIIATEEVPVDGVNGTVWRVMYHSQTIGATTSP